MRTRKMELRGIPQFDSGRWKLRLELVPFFAGKQTNHEDNPYHLRVVPVCCPLRFETFEKKSEAIPDLCVDFGESSAAKIKTER